MPTRLDPAGRPVEIEGIILRTPGLQGYAEAHRAGSPGMRAAEATTSAFETAMASEGLISQRSVALKETREAREARDTVQGMRSTSHGEPGIVMEVQAPTQDFGQLVLAVDEAGVMTWNFSVEETGGGAEATRGGGPRRTYVVRRFVAQPEADGVKTRGLVGAVGKKILKVVAFHLVDPIGGAVGEYYAGKWEAKKRPYRFRTFAPEDYTDVGARSLAAPDWEALGRGRALLMVHGTTSRAHTAFGALPESVVAELHRRYEGRVFAFDHFTLSQDPRQNLKWFFENLPDGQALDVDIVCHSRGGLVSRLLAERQSEFSLGSGKLRVGKIVLAAVPNGGTTLADPRYMGDFVDAYTNLLNFLPETGVVEAFEALVTVTKQLAVGVLRGLDGLQSMNPKGEFIRSLNQGPVCDTRYFAIAADYEPAVPGFKAFALDRLTDKIFGEHNDIVVPTHGVYRENGRGGFPVDEKFVFEPKAGVGHTNFFGQPRVHEKILEWLS